MESETAGPAWAKPQEIALVLVCAVVSLVAGPPLWKLAFALFTIGAIVNAVRPYIPLLRTWPWPRQALVCFVAWALIAVVTWQPLLSAIVGDQIAYIDASYQLIKGYPAQKDGFYRIPSDPSVGPEIKRAFLHDPSYPVQSDREVLNLALRSGGDKTWLNYTVRLRFHYVMHPRWPTNPEVVEDYTATNCQGAPQLQLCHPPVQPGSTLKATFDNVSGSYAFVEFPDEADVSIEGIPFPLKARVVVSGVMMPSRVMMLLPHRAPDVPM